MLTLQTSLRVDGISASEIWEFLANPTDDAYRRWWPGTHYRFHRLERHADHLGDVIYMDEYVGTRRLRMKAIVVEALPRKRLAWQLVKVVKLPARLELALTDYEGGVSITHTTSAGFRGAGRILDPLVRLYLSKRFARALDEHVKTEFPLLRDRLPRIQAELHARQRRWGQTLAL
jgi:hypothetical protein